MLVFPMIMAPFWRSRVTVNASFEGCIPLSASDAPVLGISAVSKLSFSTTGMHCSGLSFAPRLNCLSMASACSSTLGFTYSIALMIGPCWSYALMRSRYCCTRLWQVSLPLSKPR
jgi:hypothetical protein